jgi:hypothetical protein
MATLTGFLQDNEGAYIDKDPSAILSYTLDWSEWLPSGSSISTSSWTISTFSGDAAPITQVSTTNTGNSAIIRLSGGTIGKVYTITNTITTSGSLTDRRNFRIKVKNRTI